MPVAITKLSTPKPCAISFELVRSAVLRHYEVHGFNWIYRHLFGELMSCPAISAFALYAEFLMRQEHLEFGRKATVMRRGVVIGEAVERQAKAVVSMCERGMREGWSRLGCSHDDFSVIYVLRDPDTGEGGYVGRTVDLSYRYKAHCTFCLVEDRLKDSWLRPIIEAGKKPRLAILEVVPRWMEHDVENRWIRRLRAQGEPLTNST